MRHLLAVPLREVEHPDELVRLAAEPGVGGGARHRVRRLLVEEPAVLVDDVDDESWAWLRQSQRREARDFASCSACELEIRAEGVAAIDPRDELTDEAFPAAARSATPRCSPSASWPAGCGPTSLPARRGRRHRSRCPTALLDDVVAGLLERHGRAVEQRLRRPPRAPASATSRTCSSRWACCAGATAGCASPAIASRYAPEVVEPPPPPDLFDLTEAPS